MIIKLIQDCEVLGKSFKKGQELAVSRKVAKQLCEEEKAVANEDFPCPERVKRAAAKKKKAKKTKTVEETAEVKIENKL